MAISIDWGTKVIYVPKADTTLVQSVPTEIRELELDTFRTALKSLEDDPEGMPFLDTHVNYAPVTLSGIQLARVIEIINGYTVTFEDGLYAVNLTGANSNVADVTNRNQVGVRSANSAGLVQTKEIEFSSFEGGVWIDVNSTTTGTLYPAGTRRTPVDNLADAIIIAEYRGFSKINVLGDLTIDAGANYSDYIFIGESKDKTTLTISDAADTTNCEFYNAAIQGTLDGGNVIRECFIGDLNYVNGYIENCVLGNGTITLGGNDAAHFLHCNSGVPGLSSPTIDCGGDGPPLALRDYSGGIAIVNKTGSDDVSIDLNSGRVIFPDSTVTDGDFYIRGIGFVEGAPAGTATLNDTGLVSVDQIADTIGERQVEGTYTQDQLLRIMSAALAGKLSGADTGNVVIRDINDTTDRIDATTTLEGNRTSVTLDGT